MTKFSNFYSCSFTSKDGKCAAKVEYEDSTGRKFSDEKTGNDESVLAEVFRNAMKELTELKEENSQYEEFVIEDINDYLCD